MANHNYESLHLRESVCVLSLHLPYYNDSYVIFSVSLDKMLIMFQFQFLKDFIGLN